MNSRTAAGDVRPKGKYCPITGTLLLMLLLLAAPSAGRPSSEGDAEAVENLMNKDDYSDVDNIEFHHVKVVDGIMHEDHPIIMYKEDFVSEDYDPNKNENKTVNNTQTEQKHKNLASRSQYRALKPEKIYFDVLPQAPVIVVDEQNSNESKFDPSTIRAELVPLVENEESKNEDEPKIELRKHPKKFRSRERRDTDEEHNVRKRNPYYRHHSNRNVIYMQQYPVQQQGYIYAQPQFVRHPVQGKRPKPSGFPSRDSFGNDIDDAPVVWDIRTTKRPESKRTPPPDIWHDSNPDNDDASLFTTTQRPVATRPPAARQPARSPATTTTRPPQSTTPRVSQCVWAIVNCCSSGDYNVRYNCFEEFGCTGAFWGLNPCADNVRDNAVTYLENFYQ